MTTPEEYRQISAKYYDEAYATKEELEGLEFCGNMAKASGGPLRHGTKRVRCAPTDARNWGTR